VWIQQVYLGFIAVENELQGSILILMHNERIYGIHSILHKERVSVLHRIRDGCVPMLRWSPGDIPSFIKPSIRVTIRSSNIRDTIYSISSIKLRAVTVNKLDSV
jgi:hypothetical protein